MCLRLNDYSKIVVAENDIVCYKILRVFSKDGIKSPFQDFQYKIGETYHTDKRLRKIRDSANGVYVIKKGFHSFPHHIDAVSFNKESLLCSLNSKVYKCIIPKGTRMIFGAFGGRTSIASEAIKIIGEV